MIEFILIATSLTHIIATTSLLNNLREWLLNSEQHKTLELLTCYKCLGFWIGFIISIFYFKDFNVFSCICKGLLVSLVSDVFCRIINKLY